MADTAHAKTEEKLEEMEKRLSAMGMTAEAYNTGDKVSYNGKHYISTIDANTYAPDVYGWEATL